MTQTRNIGLATVIGTGMVLLSLYLTGGLTLTVPVDGAERTGKYRAVYGSENAETTIVEFSDFECPYCARLHPSLKKLVDESEGSINWEYRHFPLSGHRDAHFAAVVGECVLRELGNEAFWTFAETAFATQRNFSNDVLTSLGINAGLSETDIDACSANVDIQNQIEADKTAALTYGGSGTPFSVIVEPDGSTTPIRGALPLENWQSLLNLE